VSSGSALTLYFVGQVSESFPGFTAILTEFADQGLDGSCPKPYIECEFHHYCIHEVLKCNKHQNCGQNDKSDFTGCETTPPSTASHHNHKDNHNVLEGLSSTADLGLMVGCAVSIVILMVVVLWLGIVCLKRSRLQSLHRRYRRQLTPPDGVDGAVVEPSPIQRILPSPPQYFMEPPPPYTETGSASTQTTATTLLIPASRERVHAPGCGMTRTGITGGIFELPPPYSVSDQDRAGLIVNESAIASQDIPPHHQQHHHRHHCHNHNNHNHNQQQPPQPQEVIILAGSNNNNTGDSDTDSQLPPPLPPRSSGNMLELDTVVCDSVEDSDVDTEALEAKEGAAVAAMLDHPVASSAPMLDHAKDSDCEITLD